MPYASEVPTIEADHLETPSPLNPLGIKGAAKAGCIPVSAVIASAIEDAEGFPITRMPISPYDLWGAAPPPRQDPGEIPSLHRTEQNDQHAEPVIEGADRMKITGSATLAADPQQVWDAFHDPAVLARCLPGCERLTELGPDHYAMTVTQVSPPSRAPTTARCRCATRSTRVPSPTASAWEPRAPCDADVVVRLAPSSAGGTDLTYDADAWWGASSAASASACSRRHARRRRDSSLGNVEPICSGAP